jgi:hypothetical protein
MGITKIGHITTLDFTLHITSLSPKEDTYEPSPFINLVIYQSTSSDLVLITLFSVLSKNIFKNES